MKKLGLVDYECGIDIQKNPLGHTIKVLKEYPLYLCDSYKCYLIASKDILDANLSENICELNYIQLPHSIIIRQTKNIIYKIKYRFVCFFNIRAALKNSECEVLWFINVTAMLYVYLFFCKKEGKRIICTMFRQDFLSDTLGWAFDFFYRKSLSKVDLIISSSKNFSFLHNNVLFIPDYFYDKTYADYRAEKKKEMIVCLGVMDRRKKLEKLIPILNKLNYSVVIIGKFGSTEYYKEILEMASNNIVVKNEFLPKNEYYTYLGQAKFCLLPYDEQTYINRTSGVLLESVFLDTIPITLLNILKTNNVLGININSLPEMNKRKLTELEVEKYYEYYKKMRDETHNFKKIQKKLIEKVELLY